MDHICYGLLYRVLARSVCSHGMQAGSRNGGPACIRGHVYEHIWIGHTRGLREGSQSQMCSREVLEDIRSNSPF